MRIHFTRAKFDLIVAGAKSFGCDFVWQDQTYKFVGEKKFADAANDIFLRWTMDYHLEDAKMYTRWAKEVCKRRSMD